MAHEKLVAYINEQLHNGFTQDQITEVLLKSGYKKDIVDDIFDLINVTPHELGAAEDHHEMQNVNISDKQQSKKLGSEAQTHVEQRPSGKRKMNTLAITGFILSLVGILVPIIISLPAMVISTIALNQLKGSHKGERGHHLAMAGLLISLVFTLITIMFFFVMMQSIQEFLSTSPF